MNIFISIPISMMLSFPTKFLNIISKTASILGFLPVIGVFLLISGCDIDPNPLGLDTLPKDKLTSYHTDTLAVEAYTLAPITHYTYNNSVFPIGILNDPVLGKTTCNLALTYTVDKYNYTEGENYIFDTIMLDLYFRKFYPNEVGPIKIEIFELVRDIKPAHSDFDMREHYFEDSLLASLTFNPDDEQYKTYTISNDDSTLLYSKIPILLPTSFGKKFIYDGYGTTFKGFFIRTSDISGKEGTCLLTADTLELKYHNSDVEDYADSRDSATFKHTNSLSIYSHDYSGVTGFNINYDVDTLPEGSVQDSIIAIQGLDGLRAFIRIPELTSWINTDTQFVFINSAQLIIPIETDDATYDNFGTPDLLGLRLITEDGEANISDEPTISLLDNYFGGDTIDGLNKYYSINLALHLNALLAKSDTINYGFHLFCASYQSTYISTDNSNHNAYIYNVITPYRVLLNSGKNSNPMKLIITYTELNQ